MLKPLSHREVNEGIWELVQYIKYKTPLTSKYAHLGRSSFSEVIKKENTLEKTSEWKGDFNVTPEYDSLIAEAVSRGYESCIGLPKDLEFDLIMEVIESKKETFFDFDDDFKVTEGLLQLLITKGSKGSRESLTSHLLNDFMKNRWFFKKINESIDKQEIENRTWGTEDPDDGYEDFREEMAYA